MRRLLKFLHTLGAAGLMGAMGAMAVVVILTPASATTTSYVPLIAAMAKITAWVIGPSMLLTIISGLLSMAVTPAFYDAGWVWAKAATGILVLEGSLHVMGPMQEEAKRGAAALAASPDPAGVTRLLTSEQYPVVAASGGDRQHRAGHLAAPIFELFGLKRSASGPPHDVLAHQPVDPGGGGGVVVGAGFALQLRQDAARQGLA